MKKKTTLLVLIVLYLLLSACGSVPVGGMDKVLAEVDAGNYLNAAEAYQNSVLGNTDREQQTRQALQVRMENAIEDYNAGTKSVEEAANVIITIDRVGALSPDSIERANKTLSALQKSKAAFESAEALMAEKYYADALDSYLSVIEADSQYAAAQQGAEEAKNLYLSELDAALSEQIADNDYEAALNTIDKAQTMIGTDASLDAKTTEIKAKFQSYALEQAQTVFDEGGKDYASAVRVITGAINILGETEPLTAALEDYQSYIPVYLNDLEEFDSDSDGLDSWVWTTVNDDKDVQDNYGNTYKHSLYVEAQGGGFWAGTWSSVRYYVNGKYSTFSGYCITPNQDRQSDVSGYFEIYGDDVLLYTSPIMKSDSQPEYFSVDITNVSFLRIVFTPPATYDHTPSLADGILQR